MEWTSCCHPVITGASAGCGAKIAEKLVQSGMIVIGCSRNIAAIEELSEKLKREGFNLGSLSAVQCDVSKESDIISLFQKVRQDHGRVDVCINNVGIARNASLLTGETEEWRNMMEVNVLGYAICTREAFKAMKESGVDDGHIINMNSILGHRIFRPQMHFYSATKFAVKALTEGTRRELRQMKSKIRITQISPGLISTGFYGKLTGMTDEALDEMYTKVPCLSTEEVVDSVIYALAAPPNVQVHDVLVAHIGHQE